MSAPRLRDVLLIEVQVEEEPEALTDRAWDALCRGEESAPEETVTSEEL